MSIKTKSTAFTIALTVSLITIPITNSQAENLQKLKDDATKRQVALGIQAVPKSSNSSTSLSTKSLSGPNPFLAQVIDPSKVDFHGWKLAIESKALSSQQKRKAAQSSLRAQVTTQQPILVDELEPDTISGANDSLASGELIRGFGILANPRARILGTLAPPSNVLTNHPIFTEDDGAIPIANNSEVTTNFESMQTTGVLGDGPHGSTGSGTGDFDFYSVELSAGQSVTADIDITGSLDTILVLYNATGEIITVNDDDGEEIGSLASKLIHTATEAGTYYFMVAGFSPNSLPNDPFDSGSGLGAGSEGDYQILITTAKADTDIYAIDLKAGDVIGATIKGAGNRLQVFNSEGTEVIGSSQDISALYPVSSPLPGGGNAVLAYTASVEARHFIAITGREGNYDSTLEVYRAGLQKEPRRSVQTIFLDFDGARVQTRKFGGAGKKEITRLSGFLGNWGLGPDDEDPLIDEIVEVVKENLSHDLIDSGLNNDFDVEIVDSRNDQVEFGNDRVSRVVIGGTVEELGIGTVGIATSIDPGNFGHEEDAIVLLDNLSAPAPNPVSINTYLPENTTDKIKLIAQAIGNVVSHEAGHYLGNTHTDQFNESANIMDQGGNFSGTFGTGNDLLLGTSDDIDVDFGLDVFVPNEGLTGIEDTLNNSAFGLTPSISREETLRTPIRVHQK